MSMTLSIISRHTEICFYCSKKIDMEKNGAVYWLHLEKSNIFFHENCAKEFAAHLCSDAMDLKKAKKGEINEFQN